MGGPFEGRYRDASVVHDYYCKVRTTPSDDVHEMFYHAMLANGVDSIQAGLMYYAVKWYGPQWQFLKKFGQTGGYETFAVVRSSKDLAFGSDFYRQASAAAGQPSPVDVQIHVPYVQRAGKEISSEPWLYSDGKLLSELPATPRPDAWIIPLQGSVISFDIGAVRDAIKLYSTGPATKELTEADLSRIKNWITAGQPNLATLKATPPDKLPKSR
jgi:hypothetical protein